MDCFILTSTTTGVVERLVVGRPAALGYTLDLITDATSIVAIGWTRQANGTFLPPVAADAPPEMSDAERIAALEERLAAFAPPVASEGTL